MPTKLNDVTGSELKVRFKAPLVSEELNQKNTTLPKGIYRGFSLSTSGLALSVEVVSSGAPFSDHLAIVQTLDGFSLTGRRTGGNFTLDLSAFASETVVIALFVEYTTTADTFGEIRGYELLPVDEFTTAPELEELVVLGTVVVPAAGVIPAANITLDRITLPSQNLPRGLSPMIPLLGDAGFERGAAQAQLASRAAPYWGVSGTFTNGHWRFGNTAPDTGETALELQVTTSAVAISINVFQDPIYQSVLPGQRLLLRYRIRNLLVPTSGTVELILDFVGEDQTATGSTTFSVDVSAVDASYRTVEATAIVPAGTTHLRRLRGRTVATNYAATGTAFRIDNLQVFAETGEGFPEQDDRLPLYVADDVVFYAEDLFFEGLLRWASPDDGGIGFVMHRADEDDADPNTPAGLEVRGGLLLGRANQDTSARANLPIIDTRGGNFEKHLLWDSGDGDTPIERMRIFRTTGIQTDFEMTINADWNPATSQWDFDDNTSAAHRYRWGDNFFAYEHHSSGAGNPWNNNAWETPGIRGFPSIGELDLEDGQVSFTNATTGLSGSNRDKDAWTANLFLAKNTPKAWAVIECGDALGSPFASIDEGANVRDTGTDASSGDLVVRFDVTFDNTNYAIVPVVYDPVTPTPKFASIIARTTTTAPIRVWEESAGTFAALDLSSAAADNTFIMFVMHGVNT